jgi:hypothetical protein
MAIRAAIFKKTTLGAGALALVLVLPPASPARAESPIAIPDPIAQALFLDGRDLLDKGQWDTACAKFEASMLLYSAASTLLNIARCYEHQRKLASAWSAYRRVQVLNRETVGDERRQAIDDAVNAELKALTPRIPKVRLKMPRQEPGATIRLDSEVMPLAALGTDLPIDVGEHEIVAEAPGYRAFHQRVDGKEGTVSEVSIELISINDPDPRDVPKWAWVTGGASLVFLGLAAGFRIDQAFVEGRQDGYCRGNVQGGCPPRSEYDPAADNQRKNIDFGLSLGFAVAGALALGASIYGVVRASKPARGAPVATIVIAPQGALAAASFRF